MFSICATLITGLLTLLTILHFYSKKKYSYWKTRKVPSAPTVPILGNLKDVVLGKDSIGDNAGYVYLRFDAPYVGYYQLFSPALILKDLDIIKHILVKDFNKFHDRPVFSDEKADPMAFHFLLMMKNPLWRHYRAKLSPVFTSGKLKMMLPLMKDCTEDLLTYLSKHEGETLEMKEVCAKLTTDNIVSCAFGIKANSFEFENAEFRKYGRRVFDFNPRRSLQTTSYFVAPLLVSLFKFKFFDGESSNFMRKVFWETVDSREKSGVKRNDFIDLLIHLKNEDPEVSSK